MTELIGTLGQVSDALYLLLDGLDSEGNQVSEGPAEAENFVGRLRMYMGALHLIADTIENIGKALENMEEGKTHEDQT